MNERLSALGDDLERDQQQLQRELEEIDLLLRQAATEAERHEARRVQAEQRVGQLEADPATPPEALAEARVLVLTQTRRATLMQAQLDVLGGKQRALQRFMDRINSALPVVRAVASETPVQVVNNSAPPAAAAETSDGLVAQEQMRREIARQMHDGPAQSIANIALQAQIVQRLFERDPARAAQELTELVAMVQQALEATKTFIFDVRPMVLDDLGLVPTLRRSAAERSRRSSVPVRFESVGTDRRLPTEIESGLFRMIEDCVSSYVVLSATSVLVRADWSEHAVRATVQGTSPKGVMTAEQRAKAVVAAARRDKTLPDQLASMIHEQEEDEAARGRGLPEGVRAELEQRAAPLGIAVNVTEDRWQIEFVAGV
ncbi:MAG TPA: histidine kinase [Candidatus Limnocylindrales bacterium]